ncbi:hypothetical protein GB937_005990 [Aspergillus fischeri]|nr:hypothetical protein GB937_005990 [Aspergillus fischeri]
MRPVDDKRVTQILVDMVLAPKKSASDTEAVVLSPPELNNKRRGALPSNGRLVKRTAAPSSVDPGALALLVISELGNSAGSDLVVRQERPWDTFEKYYECDLAGTVAYPSKDANRILDIFRSVHHKNVVAVWACFRSPDTPDTIYTLSKFHPLTLDHVVACKAFPNQQQLAAIMSQKYIMDDGAVGIDNLKYWEKYLAAVEFLSQRLLTEICWSTGDLVGLAWFALILACTFYLYTSPSDVVE